MCLIIIELYNIQNLTMDDIDITPEQYEKVLKYMQTANEDEFQQALIIMKQNSFNIEAAINHKFSNQTSPHSSSNQRPANPQDDQQIVRKYVLHLQRRQNEWNLLKVILNVLKRILMFFCSFILNLMPYSIRIKFFGTQFQKVYFSRFTNEYYHKKLTSCLENTKNVNSKTVLLIVSPKQAHPDIINLINNPQIYQQIKNNFYMSCYVVQDSDLNKLENVQEGPLIIALRMNIFDEIVQVNRSRDLKDLKVDNLRRWANDGRNLFKRDCNVVIKYRNFISRFYGQYYEQEEEEEVNLLQRQRDTFQIKKQNELYKEIEKKAQEQKKIDEEKQKIMQQQMHLKQEEQQQRKIRKMSIPDEPTGGQIVRISFRCPNGGTIFRNFLADEKIELIYNWVQLNQQIQFEDDSRKFQIMYSFPPQGLSGRKQSVLSSVFESSQEKVVIREL